MFYFIIRLKMYRPEGRPTIEGEKIEFQAEAALHIIDRIITEIYLPFRGAEGYETERAIFVENSNVPHKENDAEHTFHIGLTIDALYDNREELRLELPPDFDINKARLFAQKHDLPEIYSRDVDGTTKDTDALELKAERDLGAIALLRRNHPYLRATADICEEYDRKDTFEAQFVSDIDKIAATRVICLDGGNKWHNWKNEHTGKVEQTTMEQMLTRYREKIITTIGHAIFDELEHDVRIHPEWFPTSEAYLVNGNRTNVQGRLF